MKVRRFALPALALVAGCAQGQPDAAAQDDAAEPAHVVQSADHHLHIRSAAAAAHQDRAVNALDEDPAEGPAEPSQATTAADVIAALDTAGIDGGVVLSNAYMYGMPEADVADAARLVREENDYVASEVAHYPSRLVALCSVNPLADYALAEVERCGTHGGFAGLKLHLANSDIDLRDDGDRAQLGRVFAAANDGGLNVLVHMRTRSEEYGADDVRLFIEDVLSHAPDVGVQIAHMAGWGGYDDATDAALGAFVEAFADGAITNPSVTFGLGAVVFEPAAAGADTALGNLVRSNNRRLANRVRQLGLDRVVYATDWPSWPPVADPSQGIARNMTLIRSALPLTDVEMESVFANVGPFFDQSR